MDSQIPTDKNNNQVSSNIKGTKNTTVSAGGDIKGNVTINNFNLPSAASVFLAAVSLFADIVALGKLAYNIIVGDTPPSNLILKFVAIILVFLLGYGLGIVGLRGVAKDPLEKILQVYVWAYLILACLSYLGVVAAFRYPYTFAFYIAYVVIIIIQLAAFMILRSVSGVQPRIAHALALMTVSVIHALVFLYYIIFVGVPDLNYLIGEWTFWFAWTMFAVPMFRSANNSGNNNDTSGHSRSPFR